MNKLIYILFFGACAMGFSQQDDTTITYKEYILNIVSEHPIAKSAQLQEKIAEANLLNAKGNFDPTIMSQYDQKDFKDTDYFKIFKNKITIPTPLGINITGGFENNDGYYLNPENNTSNRGLWSAGLEVDVIQGLLTNQRKTALQQAKVYQKIADNKQQQLLNELIFNASLAYAEWQQYYATYNVIKRSLELNKQYLKNVKSSFKNGEKTAMDTLEASVYLQNSKIELVEYKQLLMEKKLKVENNMWFNNQPVTINNGTIPETDLLSLAPKPKEIEYDLDSLPIIAEKIGKKEVLELKQKLNREKLKPKLKLKYNQLLSTSNDRSVFNPELDYDNFKWGAKLEIPIFYRAARGKYRESKYKVEEAAYEIVYKKTEISNKIKASRQNLTTLTTQIELLKDNVIGYQKLLDAEYTRFRFGESSLFLINKRQEKLIQSEIKLLKTQNKFISNYLNYMLLTNHIL